MELRPGTRLKSSTCTTEVIVVRPPSHEIVVSCGGAPMSTDPAKVNEDPKVGHEAGTALGKRYIEPASGIELLCVKPGRGSLSSGDTMLTVKDAKPLPSSD